VKIELDENLSIRLVPLLIDLGDNVETVPDEQIAGRDHHVAWTAAQADGRFLVSPSGRWSVTQATIDPKKRARFRTGPGTDSGRSPVSSSR